MYRSKSWKSGSKRRSGKSAREQEKIGKEREQEKIKKKVTWYEKDGSESVIFVPATPGSQLKNCINTKSKNINKL